MFPDNVVEVWWGTGFGHISFDLRQKGDSLMGTATSSGDNGSFTTRDSVAAIRTTCPFEP
jgi:hypothetical protein